MGPEIKIKLYTQDSELAARQLYEFLRTQSTEIRKNLQALIDDFPLTKEPNGKYVSDEDSD